VDASQTEPPAEEAVDLAQLRRFFDHPAKTFLGDRLRVTFESLDDEIDDAEPVALDGLSAHHVRAELLEHAQREDRVSVPTEPDALWRARGLLPPPPLDAGAFEEQAEQINGLLPIWRAWAAEGDKSDTLDIDLDIDGTRLVGRIGSVWPDGPRLIRPGKLRLQYKLRSWIDYLAYLAAGHDGVLRLAGFDDDDNPIECEARLDGDHARQHLASLLRLYHEGQREPLLFLPSLADLYLDLTATKGKAREEALATINDRLTDSFKPRFEAGDVYFASLFQTGAPLGESPDDTRFCELAESICQAPFETIETVGEDA